MASGCATARSTALSELAYAAELDELIRRLREAEARHAGAKRRMGKRWNHRHFKGVEPVVRSDVWLREKAEIKRKIVALADRVIAVNALR